MAGFAEIAGLMFLRRGGAVGKSGVVTIIELVGASHCGEEVPLAMRGLVNCQLLYRNLSSHLETSSRDVKPVDLSSHGGEGSTD